MTIDGTEYRKVDGAYAHLGWQSFNNGYVGPGGSGWTTLSKFLWPFLDALAARRTHQIASIVEFKGCLARISNTLHNMQITNNHVSYMTEGARIDVEKMDEDIRETLKEIG